jgi:tocopherol cyclase
LRKKNYFEGWFQKIYSHEHRTSIFLIYGIATGHSSDKKGFIQLYIPNQEHLLLYFDEKDVDCSPYEHRVQFGENVISNERIFLKTADVHINLSVSKSQGNTLARNTMGRYYFIPNLPCYHAVVDDAQKIYGEIHCKAASYQINGARGYLEKNWGTSFPKDYLWLHGFDPKHSTNQLLFSQAKIYWMGRTYTKHLGFLRYDETRINILRLRKSSIHVQKISDASQRIFISSPELTLEITVELACEIPLKAPVKGMLERSIMHHNNVSIHVRLFTKSRIREFEWIGNFENMGL